ncbi:hypothetical protein [Bradyrhizobium guangzhouense]|uniref:Uncharacterized protein n=1 Tax=Bradyrhizobium guangzhouense TaxID=1325095 RepID=A0AAE5X6P2_9BRAD|nr:hypothetical protein [Bradyrhizobium guangzhouense]QAU49684.1 hypothetical protein XH91_32835 [Bradyrhizobium guangzhouense]
MCAEVAGVKECLKMTPSPQIAPDLLQAGPTVAIAVAARLIAAGNAQSGGKLEEAKSAITDNTAALAALALELKQRNELTLLRLRAEILARIERLPIELAKDEKAYALLKQRISTDLEPVFMPRKP